METFVVRFKNRGEQAVQAERVMESAQGDTTRVFLYPTQINELAANLEKIERLVHTCDGTWRLQPWWREKGDVATD